MSSHIFNLTGDKPKTTFNSQSVRSTEYVSQIEPSHTATSQPAISTFESSNGSQVDSRKKRIVLNHESGNSRHPIAEEFTYNEHDTMTSEEITSKRMKYDDRNEFSSQRPKHMSDRLKEVLGSVPYRKDNRDDNYNNFSSYNDNSSVYESDRPIHANSKRADKLERENYEYKRTILNLQEKIRESEIQFDEFKMVLRKQYKKQDDERQEAFLNMRKTYEDVINKVIKNDSHSTPPVEIVEGKGKSSESKFQDNVNKLMSYLTSVTVTNQTESDVGILFDCEITSNSSNRSLKFTLNIPNDDTKLVDYTPVVDQLDESAIAAIPDFLRESIVFAKQALPVFFWRLSSSIQGAPN